MALARSSEVNKIKTVKKNKKTKQKVINFFLKIILKSYYGVISVTYKHNERKTQGNRQINIAWKKNTSLNGIS